MWDLSHCIFCMLIKAHHSQQGKGHVETESDGYKIIEHVIPEPSAKYQRGYVDS